MGRIERQKRQLIEEANKRVIGVIKEDDEKNRSFLDQVNDILNTPANRELIDE